MRLKWGHPSLAGTQIAGCCEGRGWGVHQQQRSTVKTMWACSSDLKCRAIRTTAGPSAARCWAAGLRDIPTCSRAQSQGICGSPAT